MVRIGNFLFHYRNGLFPLVYLVLLVKSPLLLADYRVAALAGLSIALLGQFIRAVTIGLDYIKRGGKNRQVYADRLVQGGIFAHCRNPLYVGNLLTIAGVAVASNSVVFLAVAGPFFLFAYCAIVAAEENYLRGKFGSEFEEYCQRVHRWWLNPVGITATLRGMRFHWARLVIKEYGSTYAWMVAVIFVTLRSAWLAGDYATANPLIRWLWALFAVVSLAYLLARIAKKKRYLQDWAE